jgi:hypothetical protein
MDTHKRRWFVPLWKAGLSKAAATRTFNTTPTTVRKWVDRFLTKND